jgi:hypothetical protein
VQDQNDDGNDVKRIESHGARPCLSKLFGSIIHLLKPGILNHVQVFIMRIVLALAAGTVHGSEVLVVYAKVSRVGDGSIVL